MEIFAKGIGQIQALINLGGPVVALLLVMSFLALVLILVKVFSLIGFGFGFDHTKPLDLWLDRLDRGDDIKGAIQNGKGLLVDIAERSWQLRQSGEGEVMRERAIMDADHALAKLDWGNRALELIAQTAPLLGLFGTVLGMIDAFRALQAAGSVVDPSVLAGGIWVALLTTAVGLAVAMPVSVVLSFFEAHTEKVRRRAEQMIEVIFRPATRG